MQFEHMIGKALHPANIDPVIVHRVGMIGRKQHLAIQPVELPPHPLLLLAIAIEPLGFNVTQVYGLTEVYGPATECLWRPEWEGIEGEERASLKARTGVAMAMTMYDAAFATLSQHSGTSYRTALTALTLMGGLASTVFWPTSLKGLEWVGWRDTMVFFALLQLLVCLPLHLAFEASQRVFSGSVGQEQLDRRGPPQHIGAPPSLRFGRGRV